MSRVLLSRRRLDEVEEGRPIRSAWRIKWSIWTILPRLASPAAGKAAVVKAVAVAREGGDYRLGG